VRSLALVPLVSILLVGSSTGVRLLLLARRTRQPPELVMGLGLVLITLLAIPLVAIGRLPGLVATPSGDALLGLGLAAASAGVGLLFAFTWKVFHPGSRWARGVVVAASAVMGAAAVALLHASSQGETLEEILPRTRPWACLIVAMVSLAFGWTGLESARYHALMKRRLRLGLADPLVVNRFLLWSLSGVVTAALCASLIGFLWAGRRMVLHDPAAAGAIALAAATVSAAWYLAFFPPAAYRRAIRRRFHIPE
jgi:hypothetical protein